MCMNSFVQDQLLPTSLDSNQWYTQGLVLSASLCTCMYLIYQIIQDKWYSRVLIVKKMVSQNQYVYGLIIINKL